MLEMAMPWLLALEIVLYSGCFICGIISAASLTMTQGQFAGQCVLYGSVYYNKSTQSIGIESASSPSLCYFVSAISICVSVYCLSLILYWIYSSCVDGEFKRGSVWMSVSLGACGVISFFLLLSGCILRIGRDHLCQSLLHSVPAVNSCEMAQNKTWTSPVNGQQFFQGFESAEKSVWVNFFFWMLVVVVVSVQRRSTSENRQGGADWNPAEAEPFFHRSSRT
ncbi:transmembrane protein 179B [Brienomyrus brachyistius]|uniref:transmembrane protein 179B n=1 Tax=Brienomyrus brachyistius TaxID=42636 RepID=UPI0020B2A23F|nr:transmembrane protein 179B [Brienomyrus brachyistius]XP_048854060.1 transmembrane protein 179B [Brienomyrus brachyistius]XP_048854061.1 transmembrane protein 179B [Brienomyrus brachyistius]